MGLIATAVFPDPSLTLGLIDKLVPGQSGVGPTPGSCAEYIEKLDLTRAFFSLTSLMITVLLSPSSTSSWGGSKINLSCAIIVAERIAFN